MSCNGNLRIHLKLRDDASEERLEGPEAFSDVDKIVALGGVTVTRADPRGKDAPITAKAETATYDAESENLVLRGGLPMIRQGKSFLKAREQGLYLLFKANGSFEAKEGSWEQYIEDQDFEKLREQKDKLGN